MKIAILGYSGSGKSTLARELAALHGLPVLHLDTVMFLPNWQERPQDEQLAIVQDFMDSYKSWVIDGNYSNLLQPRSSSSSAISALPEKQWNTPRAAG